jgi:hypothetical protein
MLLRGALHYAQTGVINHTALRQNHLLDGNVVSETDLNFPYAFIRVNGRGPCRPHVRAPAALGSRAPGDD